MGSEIQADAGSVERGRHLAALAPRPRRIAAQHGRRLPDGSCPASRTGRWLV
jgi:hypothetical protein